VEQKKKENGTVNAVRHRSISPALGYGLHKLDSIHDRCRPCVLKSFKVSATGCASVFRAIQRKRYIVTKKTLEKHRDRNRADSKLWTIINRTHYAIIFTAKYNIHFHSISATESFFRRQ
jgi:ribosomal protein L37E